MLTSPKANDTEMWPSLSRRKEIPSFSNDGFLPLKSSNRFHAVSTGSSRLNVNNEHSDDESIDLNIDEKEPKCAPPEFNESFGSAISEALNNAALLKNPRKQEIVSLNQRASGSKKKKANKMILFSTGGHTFDGK